MPASAADELMERVAELERASRKAEVDWASAVADKAIAEAARKHAETERDEYKRLYVSMLEHVRKLEAGLVGQKSERHVPPSEQLTMDVVSTLVGEATDEAATPAPR